MHLLLSGHHVLLAGPAAIGRVVLLLLWQLGGGVPASR